MIFARVATAAVIVTAIVIVMGDGGPDPGVALEASRVVDARAAEADAALAEMEELLSEALSTGRAGVARTAAGDEPPGPAFLEAADRLEASVSAATRADRAVRALGAARVAASADTRPIDAITSPDDIAAIAVELRGLAASADGFADLRRRAEGLNPLLAEALERTEAGDLDDARAAVEAARANLEALAAWDSGLTSLPVWLETAEELVSASEDLVRAARAGDEAAVDDAADRVAALGEEAVFADRALRIAISEGAAFAADGPMAALAEAERRTIETREQVASILQAAGR